MNETTNSDRAHRFTAPERLEIVAIPGLPMIGAGDDLAMLIASACLEADIALQNDDVLVVAQKIVSKSEGRLVALDSVTPGAEARALAAATGKDAAVVELILRESVAVLRHTTDLIIVEHRQGFVMANAGIDQSNVPAGSVLLLPEDVDASARTLRSRLGDALGFDIGIIVSDSVGRAWRNGTTGHALGVAGITSLLDLRGAPDLYGRELRVSETAIGDNLAAAASLLIGEAREGTPVVLIRGLSGLGDDVQSGKTLLRDKSRDLFR